MSGDPRRGTYPSLIDRLALVTGGASGIGATIVTALARQQAQVAVIDVDDRAANTLCDRIEEEAGRRPWYLHADVTDVPALQAAVASAIADLGGLSILVNNVGNDTRHTPDEVSEAFWRKTLAINLDAAFFATQAAAPALLESGGSIINIGSIQTILGSESMVAYITAKSGLAGLTKALASDYGHGSVRVNTITPGWVLTERQRELWATPEAIADWQQQSRLQGELLPEDIASMVLFLAADDSRMITAQDFVVDAGRG